MVFPAKLVRSGVVDGVVRTTGVVVMAGLTVVDGEAFALGVGVGVSDSSALIAKAELWLKRIAAMVNVLSRIFIGPC